MWTLPRRISLVVLHEDMLHQSFASAFLNRLNLPTRPPVRFVHAGNKAGVISLFSDQVKGMLDQGAETHLLVLMDADGQSYASNEIRLLSSLDPTTRTKLQMIGRWHLICPQYELENWCRHLEGQEVAETRNLALAYREDSDCRPVARKLAETCQSKGLLTSPLPSLADACSKWNTFLAKHKL